MSIFADRKTLRSRDESFTRALGMTLGARCEGGELLVLIGELGTGKTTFVKGLAEGLGVTDTREVTSPTFLRIQEYEGRVHIYHVDAYRMTGGMEEFISLGGDEMLESGGVTVIEWGERLMPGLPGEHLTMRFSHGESEDERLIALQPRGLHYAKVTVGALEALATSLGENTEEQDDAPPA
jgi:tRNA threonylcarbamoyladenosine biosynthesis protein TsaE